MGSLATIDERGARVTAAEVVRLFEPSPEAPWDLPRVAHLHRRAGFAAPWGVLERDRRDGPGASVERLLNGEPKTGDGRPAAAFDDLLDAMALQLAPSAGLTRLHPHASTAPVNNSNARVTGR